MTTKTLVVVADKFFNFTTGKQAVTESQVRAMIELPEHIMPGRTCLIRGQGLSDNQVLDLRTSIAKCDPNGHRWDISLLSEQPNRADAMLSHKSQYANTLICQPERISDKRFRLDVCIDQDGELMSDHQTGQHVQGMILIEAARQSFLAVTEMFFRNDAFEKTYFVINSMTTDFIGFIFPLSAHIEYHVLSHSSNERRQKFDVEMHFVQGGEVRTRVGFSFTVYPHEVIASKEARLAEEAILAVLGMREGGAVAVLGNVA